MTFQRPRRGKGQAYVALDPEGRAFVPKGAFIREFTACRFYRRDLGKRNELACLLYKAVYKNENTGNKQERNTRLSVRANLHHFIIIFSNLSSSVIYL